MLLRDFLKNHRKVEKQQQWINRCKCMSEIPTLKIKNVITYIFFETTEVAKDVLMTWVWHPMGREGLEPATR